MKFVLVTPMKRFSGLTPQFNPVKLTVKQGDFGALLFRVFGMTQPWI